MDKKEVQLVEKSNGKLCLLPIDKFYDEEDYVSKPIICKVITQEILGWWVYERTEVGGASDMIGDNTVVRDITKKDVEGILDNKGKCFVDKEY